MSSTKFVFFGQIGETRWPPRPLIGWDIFDFSSETTEQNSNETWQEVRSQRSLPSLCFLGGFEKQDGCPFVFFSEIAERHSTKLDRKQDYNILYEVCVFRVDWINKMATPASDWLRHFRLLLWSAERKWIETWQEARSECPLRSLCFSDWSEKQDGHPSFWYAEAFSTSHLKPLNASERNSTKVDRKQDLNVLSVQVCVFRADQKK